jgi:hypothetical protein
MFLDYFLKMYTTRNKAQNVVINTKLIYTKGKRSKPLFIKLII